MRSEGAAPYPGARTLNIRGENLVLNPMPDELDAQILRLLQKDGRLTSEQIGELLDRSPSTIRDRIKRLEEERGIMGYAAIVDHAKIGILADAYVSADIRPDLSSKAMTELFSLENVSEILHLTGERRILLRIKAKDNHELMEIIDRKIRPLGFDNIEIKMILEPIVRYPGI
jgi:Lrp/AsnC family leucine-responsive transcriptional regulator